ncbi:bifunctional glycosyltransferase/CDP-glycerol:glycerophosphate glycerophosphotransferase [Streptomyces fulvorobeus]|uniref:CDP-glycerol glycerophosphotransferase n=1 Tax=Streptomyces fulvorobeus TaxID=284028 RepID=A0A7J0C4L2_9ACTN|nr:bifunctional glycosyltransferase/CDP-glycerol:glycerophosphate glycerophosphotransferase [Streptomyces fulvorobeus]NYE41135.1 CDP-glycerol glycerophosphotransferase [Streptomyces fulvorobeus]GFM97465.1 glycosyl transferase [Streptomyces fulvorobeus]
MLLSVVMAVSGGPGYLRASVDSVLDQPVRELELLLTGAGACDTVAAIAADYRQRDTRVRQLAGTVTAGGARDAGADEARGAYLLFLDGGDLLLPGVLERIAALTAESRPDVLRLGHDRVDRWDAVRPGASGAVPAARNQLFRRDFWAAHGLRFTGGPYADVLPVQRAYLLASDAGTLATLDLLCVRHRLPATGERRGAGALLDAYGRLLTETGGDPRAAAARTAHLRALLDMPDDAPEAVPARDRAALFRAAKLPGPYAAHRARGAVRTARALVPGALLRGRKAVRTRVLRTAYRADLLRPLDPCLAVYGAYWNRGIACNPAAIHAKALELAPHVRGVWAVSSRHRDRVPPGVPYVIEGSLAYWRAMATATYLVNNSSFPGGFTKRPGQVYLQTHHGTPLKTMGLDQRGYPALANGVSFEKIVAHADQWDYSLSANPHSTEIWDRVYPSSYEHLNLGYPRNDVLFTTTAERTAEIRAGLGIAPGQKALLYAPTHRDYRKGFLPRLDLELLARELGPDHVLLVRAHYFYGRSAGLPGATRGRVVDVTGHPRVEELCLASDALVTDYSSLMFDYACLDRPIIGYAPDWAAYRASRGTYFDPLSGRPGETPGAVATTQDELVEAVRSGLGETGRTKVLRKAFRDRFCPYDDGGAAERVVRRLFLDGGPG